MDDNIPESCVTGIEDISDHHGNFNIHPNPFIDKVFFSIYRTEYGIESIRVIDNKGGLVKMIICDKRSKDEIFWDGLDDSGHSVSEGIYLVILTFSNGEFITSKIVKN